MFNINVIKKMEQLERTNKIQQEEIRKLIQSSDSLKQEKETLENELDISRQLNKESFIKSEQLLAVLKQQELEFISATNAIRLLQYELKQNLDEVRGIKKKYEKSLKEEVKKYTGLYRKTK